MTRSLLGVIASSGSGLVIKADGGTITVDETAGYVYHTFTANGSFSPLVDLQTQTLTVGGGGPTTGTFGGGGGAGGYLANTPLFYKDHVYSVTIGAGGAAGTANNGSPTTIVTSTGANYLFNQALGGGFGGRSLAWNSSTNGNTGGSGGGGASNYSSSGPMSPGNGTPGQGNAGGAGTAYNFTSRSYNGGGGGGASQVGQVAIPGGTGGKGGNGSTWLNGSTYAGGGGGGIFWEQQYGTTSPESFQSAGGTGGGGKGVRGVFGTPPNLDGENGQANTGGGGGGGNYNGGSGILIIRYPI